MSKLNFLVKDPLQGSCRENIDLTITSMIAMKRAGNSGRTTTVIG
jgi:hypothetical protein